MHARPWLCNKWGCGCQQVGLSPLNCLCTFPHKMLFTLQHITHITIQKHIHKVGDCQVHSTSRGILIYCTVHCNSSHNCKRINAKYTSTYNIHMGLAPANRTFPHIRILFKLQDKHTVQTHVNKHIFKFLHVIQDNIIIERIY